MSSVVTRFAPSPTGFLHIGGARTALFAWLFAQHHKGKMLLRIEDTDQERSTEPAIHAILEGLTWLDLSWDGEVVYQSQRTRRHQEVAHELLKNGKAYLCYATPEELTEMREQARAEGRAVRYDGRWRDRAPSAEEAQKSYVIRLKIPQEGETSIEDMVQGRVSWSNSELDDFVLLRSDGTPTYMLAVVVDDHDMGVTHIIRGVDHLTNAARQKHIYEALGWSIPQMAHIPLIHGSDGSKLSKRHGALAVDAYRTMGYLPGAMRNALARLGWSHGDQEIFSTEQLIDAFSLEHVGQSAARFDLAKLENLNAHYIRESSDEVLLQALEAFVALDDVECALTAPFTSEIRERLRLAFPGLKPRSRTLVELLDQAAYLYTPRPLPLEDDARTLLSPEVCSLFEDLILPLDRAPLWTEESLESVVRHVAAGKNLKLGQLAQPMRAALTGRTKSQGLFEIMVVLGREETLERLRDQLNTVLSS
jgi:glutamyl-tRNA synthetase